MAERRFRAARAASVDTEGEPQTAWRQAIGIVIAAHEPCGLWPDGPALAIEELAKEPGDVGGGGVHASPWRAQHAPVGTVPVPLPRRGVSCPGLRRGAVS